MVQKITEDCENCAKTVNGPEEVFKTASVDGEKHYFCGIECKVRWLGQA